MVDFGESDKMWKVDKLDTYNRFSNISKFCE